MSPPSLCSQAKRRGCRELERALEANDREELVTTFLRDQIRVPPEQHREDEVLADLADRARDLSHLAARDRAPSTRISPFDERLANWKAPTTVLLGSVTAGLLKDAAFFLRDTIPGCRMVVLEGQGHGAMLDAPDFFAAKILEIA